MEPSVDYSPKYKTEAIWACRWSIRYKAKEELSEELSEGDKDFISKADNVIKRGKKIDIYLKEDEGLIIVKEDTKLRKPLKIEENPVNIHWPELRVGKSSHRLRKETHSYVAG